MRSRFLSSFILFFLCAVFSAGLSAQELPAPTVEQKVVAYKPKYVPPTELLDVLGVRPLNNLGVMEWFTGRERHMAEIRLNETANLIIISGPVKDVDYVEELIKAADLAPRQIEIEVQIIEVNKSKARDLGIDWDVLWQDARTSISLRYRREEDDDYRMSRSKDYSAGVTRATFRESESERRDNDGDYLFNADIRLDDAVRLLDSKGAGTIKNAPRILTLNNRRATILDGRRVTYITRYSSYTNLFETDSLDAGLNLSVTPSLGESGYITMDIVAEYTDLDGSISGSPVKIGQMLENTVIVKDGQSILLGGLTQYIEGKQIKRFPILGHVLPFLFSREITIKEEIESIIVLTPRVLDLTGNLDDHTKELLEKN